MFLFILNLQFIIFLQFSYSYELREQDALCGPIDSCYVVFYQRRTFLESWRACRERGGNLATVKNAQEAALVEQLLTSSTNSRSYGNLQQRLWIGLQRQPRQCTTQKPLRGFTWTTGDQDTAYTNWVTQPVSAGSPSSCSAPRCVAIGLGSAKPEDDFKWLDGSCTLPVDGFVCKFRYQGLCPVLSEENVRYSLPFGYEGTWLDSLPFGTMAVVSCEGHNQGMSVLCMLKEDGTFGWNKEPVCQTPENILCQRCQQMCERGTCTCQEGYVLQPDGYSCEPDDDPNYETQGCPCQYQCVAGPNGKGYQCTCPEGHELTSDEHSCEDIDECEDEDTCEHSCHNTLGSYTCACDLGFTVAEDDPERCVDIDECHVARMCQQMCVNYIGGFECYCNDGYELEPDRVNCKPMELYKEPKYEPNPPVIRIYEPELETSYTTTEGRHWPELDESVSWTNTDEPKISFEEETTTFEPLIKEIAETTTTPLEWEEDEETTTSHTVTPARTTSLLAKMDKFRRTILQSTLSSIPSIPSTVSAIHISAKIPKDNSEVNLWLRVKPTSELLTTVQPGTIIGVLAEARPTTKSSRSLVNDDNPSTTGVSATGAHMDVNTIPLKDRPRSNNSADTISPDLPDPPPSISQETKGKRDNRWLVVALLVPLCVFLVVMLALGIVYCTRCGGEAKPRSVTDCYHWVTGSAPEKGLPPPGVEKSNSRGAV
ncbi:endosialin [Hyperolius riggenbachi]|uniref:endosialin n=1 Tax=Hyperolius riggenbachi TaxID=752182 RepID=UPI0035A31B28